MLGKTLSSVLIVENENGDVYFIEDTNKKNKIPCKNSKQAKIRIEEIEDAEDPDKK